MRPDSSQHNMKNIYLGTHVPSPHDTIYQFERALEVMKSNYEQDYEGVSYEVSLLHVDETTVVGARFEADFAKPTYDDLLRAVKDRIAERDSFERQFHACKNDNDYLRGQNQSLNRTVDDLRTELRGHVEENQELSTKVEELVNQCALLSAGSDLGKDALVEAYREVVYLQNRVVNLLENDATDISVGEDEYTAVDKDEYTQFHDDMLSDSCDPSIWDIEWDQWLEQRNEKDCGPRRPRRRSCG